MRGAGYTSPTWGHGLHHGKLELEREDIDIDAQDPARLDNFQRPMPCRAVLGGKEQGVAVFEQIVLGPSARFGLDGRGTWLSSAGGQSCQLVLAQFDAGEFEQLVQLLHRPRTGDRGGDAGLANQPSERDRRKACVRLGRHLVHRREHLRPVFSAS